MHLYFPTKIDINGDVFPMIRRPVQATSTFTVEVNETVQGLLPGFVLETLAQAVYDDSTNWWIMADANLPRIHPADYNAEDKIIIPQLSEMQSQDQNTQRQRLFRAL